MDAGDAAEYPPGHRTGCVPPRNRNRLVQNVKSAEVENSYIDGSESRSGGGGGEKDWELKLLID